MAAQEDRIQILKIAIGEMRSTFNHVSNIYDQLRIKALGVLAGEVALITFMFSGDGVAIPDVAYGRIFFFTGVFFLGAAFGLLLWTLSPLEWKMPYDEFSSEALKKYKTEEEFLEYLNDDHIVATQHCLKYVSLKARRFTWTLYLLSAGAIILMVIKFGG
jgi:hypothetical protein